MRIIHWKLFFTTIFITLLLLALFVAWRHRMPLDNKFRRKKRSYCLEKCKTGDIVTVAYGSMRATIIKQFTGSMWAHSGIILRAPPSKEFEGGGKPYVLEAGLYSRTNKGVMVTPLEEWLDYNKDYIIGWRQYEGQGIPREKIKEFAKTHDGKGIDMFIGNWLKSMFKRRYVEKDHVKRKYFCSELVSHFLQETNVMRKKYKPSSYKPWELLYGNLPLNKSHKYGKSNIVVSENEDK